MLADERTKIAFPLLFSVMVEGRDLVMLGLIPDDLHAFGVNARRGRRETILN